MSLKISTNLPAISAMKTLAQNGRELQKTYTQLSSGSRITKAGDDAAGLSISETLKSTMRGYGQARRNANDGISMVQVSEGGLGEISNMITRLRELAVQAASDTVGVKERGFIDLEVQQLKNEIQRIAETSRFGDVKLLDGSGGMYEFQVDINNDDFADRISFDAGHQDATLASLSLDGLDYNSKEDAQAALEILEASQTQVNGQRAVLGALQNRLVSTVENLTTSSENFAAANSRIRDTDVAESSANLAKDQVLQQTAVGILAQANQSTAVALKLVG